MRKEYRLGLPVEEVVRLSRGPGGSIGLSSLKVNIFSPRQPGSAKARQPRTTAIRNGADNRLIHPDPQDDEYPVKGRSHTHKRRSMQELLGERRGVSPTCATQHVGLTPRRS